jgi:hypothetical protein
LIKIESVNELGGYKFDISKEMYNTLIHSKNPSNSVTIDIKEDNEKTT